MMLSRIVRHFATTTNKTYGKLKDADRIFTNVYKDTSPYIDGALRRVTNNTFRETGIEPKTYYSMGLIGSSTKSNSQDSEEEGGQDSPQDSNTPSCPKSPPKKDLVT